MLLLISAKSIAVETVTNETFDAFIAKAEKLKDINTNEAFEFITQQNSIVSSLSIENQLTFYNLSAEIHVELAKYKKCKEITTYALKLARGLSSPSITTSELLYSRGYSFESLGDYDAAREDYLNGLEIADSLNNKKIMAIGLVNIGALDYLIEKFDRSLIMFNDALTIAQKIKDDELSGFINSEIGVLYSLINQSDKSLAFYQKAYEYYQKAGKINYAYNTLSNIASNHLVNQRYEQAIGIYEEIISNIKNIGNNELIAGVYSGMAWAHIKKADKDPEASYQYMLIASQYIEQAEQVDIPIGHALDKGYLFMELGRYEEALENMHIATEYYKNYQGEEQKMVNTLARLNLLFLKAETYYKIENYKEAYLAQDEYITFALSLPEKSNVDETEDIRMRYESEQADLHNKILEQEKSVQSLLLSDAKKNSDNRQILIISFALIALILAWILVKIIRGQRQLLTATRTDSLTRVANRRRLIELGERIFEQSVNDNLMFSLLIIDVDDFKKINDQCGHKIGDNVLKQISLLGQNLMRADDLFGRFGGEEFVVLLPNTTKQQAVEIAERIRLSICQYRWSYSKLEKVTLSIGVAHLSIGEHQTFDELVKEADQLLYQAKHQGKNKVCVND
ncbi:diguanylate cyclase [Colwelliaceae bacterium 6441]